MKTSFIYKGMICLLVLLSVYGCQDGFENLDHLVKSYDNAPWMLYTKLAYQEKGVEIESYNSFSQMMSGFGNIDQFIELCTYHSGNRTTDYQTYSSIKNKTEYEALCTKHNDRVDPPVNRGAFYLYPQFCLSTPFSATDFVALEVTSTEAFDEGHPAGSSLLDLLHYATTTPNRVLINDYQFRFDTDVIVDEKGTQLFNTYKIGSEVCSEDMSIINFIFLSFDKLPNPIGPRKIKVQLTADDGTAYCFDTILTFSKIV